MNGFVLSREDKLIGNMFIFQMLLLLLSVDLC